MDDQAVTAQTAATQAAPTQAAASAESPATAGRAGFTITRVFDAPRATIWNAWTDPAMAPVWWHPRGVSTPAESVEFDLRIGGQYTYTMVNDATGEEYPTAGVYREISEPERLSFTWASPGDDVETAPLITIVLAEHGDGAEQTEMTFRVDGWAGQPGDGNVYDGWASAFELLDESLA